MAERKSKLAGTIFLVKEISSDDPRSPLELLRSGVWCRRTDVPVPFTAIDLEDSIVDDSRVTELAVDMEMLGQGSAIWLMAAEVDGLVRHKVIDGFHRCEALPKHGITQIRSTIDYNMPEQRFYQERIIATSKKTVEYPRVAEWIKQWWAGTEWAQKGLTARQAISLATVNRNKSSLLESEEDRARLRKEVLENCERWGKSTSYILRILAISDDVDPQLIRQVRTANAGRGTIVHLTPSRLGPIVAVFPGESNYLIQGIIAEAVLKGGFSGTQTSFLVENLSTIIDSNMKKVDIKKWVDTAVTDLNIAEFKNDKKARNGTNVLNDEDEDDEDADSASVPATSKPSADSVVVIPNLRNERSVRLFTDREVDAVLSSDVPEIEMNGDRSSNGQIESQEMGIPYKPLHSAAYDIAGRTVSFEPSGQKRVETSEAGRAPGWWETARFLSDEEREVMTLIFSDGLDSEQASIKLHKRLKEIGTAINESLKKQILHKRNLRRLRHSLQEDSLT